MLLAYYLDAEDPARDVEQNQELAALLNDVVIKAFFTRSARTYGCFSNSEDNAEDSWPNALAQALDADDLANCCFEYARQWRAQLDEFGLQPGVLYFAQQNMGEESWLYIVWSEAQSRLIAKDGVLEHCDVIDPERIDAAIKIHINDWRQNQGQRALMQLGSGNAAVKLQFARFFDFNSAESTKAETNTMLDVVERYARSLETEQQGEYRDRVVDFCQQREQLGETITIQELAEVANESEPQQFKSFAMEHDIDPNRSWLPDRNELKRYQRFYGRDPSISISFSSNLVGNGIEYDEEAETLLIKATPKGLKQQLKKFSKSN